MPHLRQHLFAFVGYCLSDHGFKLVRCYSQLTIVVQVGVDFVIFFFTEEGFETSCRVEKF